MNATDDLTWDASVSYRRNDERVRRMVRKSKDDCFNVIRQDERETWMGCDVIGCTLGAALNKHPPLTQEGVRYCTAHYCAWKKLCLEGELQEYYDSMKEELNRNETRRVNTLNLSG